LQKAFSGKDEKAEDAPEEILDGAVSDVIPGVGQGEKA
jgi:hypothetical protein